MWNIRNKQKPVHNICQHVYDTTIKENMFYYFFTDRNIHYKPLTRIVFFSHEIEIKVVKCISKKRQCSFYLTCYYKKDYIDGYS